MKEEESAMKYFKMTEALESKQAPRLIDWYGRFDVRDISYKGYGKLPDREMFFVEQQNETIFIDIICSPFLLISPRVNQVLRQYRVTFLTKEIILLHPQSGKPELYYLPVLNEIHQAQMVTYQFEDGKCIWQSGQPGDKRFPIEQHIFWVKEGNERHTVLSLDLAESLIRRGITGLGLEEIQLYYKVQEEL